MTRTKTENWKAIEKQHFSLLKTLEIKVIKRLLKFILCPGERCRLSHIKCQQ